MKKYLRMSSAAVVIGALGVNPIRTSRFFSESHTACRRVHTNCIIYKYNILNTR